MKILVTGTQGSGKTTLTKYDNSLENNRFIDADEIRGLCEWREHETGKVLGLVTEYPETGKNDWYATYGWYWRPDVLAKLLTDNQDAIVCGSSENIVECYSLFNRIIVLKKDEEELLSNLASPDRNNPFGKTPEQRKNFMNWQKYLIDCAKEFNAVVLEDNDIAETYRAISLQVPTS